jgi:hypothetical protein
MGVMNWVYPITALYFGPFTLALYWRWGRADATTTQPATWAPAPDGAGGAPIPDIAPMHEMAMASMGPGTSGHADHQAAHIAASPVGRDDAHAPRQPATPDRPWWATMAIEVSHCGSGCKLGDLIAEWLIFTLGVVIAGYALFAEIIGFFTSWPANVWLVKRGIKIPM